jgi:hypothetical protein
VHLEYLKAEGHNKSELLVLLKPCSSREVRRKVTESGGPIKQSYGARVLSVDATSDTHDTLKSHSQMSVFGETVPDDVLEDLDDTAKLAVGAWNERQSESFRTKKRERKAESLP